MKHLLKLNKDRNGLDKLANKKIINNISKKFWSLGVSPSRKVVPELMVFWTIKCLEYENTAVNNAPTYTLINSLSRLTTSLKASLKILKQYGQNYPKNQDEKLVKLASSMKDQFQIINLTAALLKNNIEMKCSKKAIKLEAMSRLFSIGESLGLEASTKRGAGSKNINKLFKFVTIISGISSRTTLRRFYLLYKNHQVTE